MTDVLTDRFVPAASLTEVREAGRLVVHLDRHTVCLFAEGEDVYAVDNRCPHMEELDLPRVAVIALAKRDEEVFVPGFPAPIALDRSSPALQLLQRIRDEAHRVALRYHRRKRGARSMETIFETLPGVGPVRRRAIIRHFGSVERFLEASQEELEGVPGLPQKIARDLYAQLHKAGPS